MKKLILILALVAMCVTNAAAQNPWKIVDMEGVTKHGSKADYDNETLTATFFGQSDRWIDLPDVKGDLSEHTTLELNIEKSDCVLRIALRYKDADGKTQQTNVATCYGSMANPVTKHKTLKIDLTNKGKITADMLSQVVGIRIAMAKPSTDKVEPWDVTFGEVAIY